MNNTQKSAHRQNGQNKGHAEQTPSPQKHNKNVRAQCKRIFSLLLTPTHLFATVFVTQFTNVHFISAVEQ